MAKTFAPHPQAVAQAPFSEAIKFTGNPEADMALAATTLSDAQLETAFLATDADSIVGRILLAELDRRMEAPAPRTTADHGIEEWEAGPALAPQATPAQARAIEAAFKAEDKAMGAPLLATAPVARIAIEDAGVYMLPSGDVVRVKANKAKTRTYASRWVASKHLDRLMEAGAHEHGEYVYEQGLVAEVARTGRKMSLEEAKAHSIRFGQCVRCGRKLTDGRSVEAGMGPVCIKYFA